MNDKAHKLRSESQRLTARQLLDALPDRNLDAEEIMADSALPPTPPKFATVSWTAADLDDFDGIEHWTDEEKEDFLYRNAKHILSAMVEAGYSAIEAAVAYEQGERGEG